MIVGLHGKAGTGKDTIAAQLYHVHDFSRVSFAGPLKDMLIAFGIARGALEDREAKEAVIRWLGKSPRELMQTLGTEWGRNTVRQDIWIQHAARRMATHLQFSPHVVFTDVRFDNEAAFIRSQGGTIWHILRPAAEVARHISEEGLEPEHHDSILRNDGAIEDIPKLVRRALKGELRVFCGAGGDSAEVSGACTASAGLPG